jgi:hypothetical protein
MSFNAIQAGLLSAWTQISSAGSAVIAKGSEFFATYAPVVKTQAVALATFAHVNFTVPAVAESTTLLAPLGAAGPCIWLLPTLGAGLISMALQAKGDQSESTMATIAWRVAGLAFAITAGAAAAIFMGSILGLGTAVGIAATYGTGAFVALAFTLFRPYSNEYNTV